MMTPDKIKMFYTGPFQTEGQSYLWHQKGRRWPRVRYFLAFDVKYRQFNLSKRTHHQTGGYTSEPVTNEGEVFAFRSLLTPTQLARCMAASINRGAEHADA